MQLHTKISRKYIHSTHVPYCKRALLLVEPTNMVTTRLIHKDTNRNINLGVISVSDILVGGPVSGAHSLMHFSLGSASSDKQRAVCGHHRRH